MSKTIEGVPEFLTREQYLAPLAAIGLSPEAIQEVRWANDGIHALVFELADDGMKKYHSGGQGAIKHRVFIPIRDDDEDTRTTRVSLVKN